MRTGGWESDDDKKNRRTLIRALVWYCDEQTDEGGIQPYAFPGGKAALEVDFLLPVDKVAGTGEEFLLRGKIDSLATLGDEVFVRERKTTGSTIGSYYFENYAPNVQVDTYDLAAWLLFPSLKIRGVLLEATQLAVGFARFLRQPLYHTPARREEWLASVHRALEQAETYARATFWPMNTAVCNLNGGCPFREVCRRDPSQRLRHLVGTDHFEVRRSEPVEAVP